MYSTNANGEIRFPIYHKFSIVSIVIPKTIVVLNNYLKYQSAIKFFDAVCSRFLPYRARPFDLLGEDDVQHDNRFFITGEFERSIIANCIPKDEGWPYKGGWEKTDTERLGRGRIEKLFNSEYQISYRQTLSWGFK